MNTSADTPDYVSLTVSDRNGKVELHVTSSEHLTDEDYIIQLAGLVIEGIKGGIIDIPFDSQREGEMMLVFEDDGEDGVDLEAIMNPTVTLSKNAISPAQALALSAVKRVESKNTPGFLEFLEVEGEYQEPDGDL